MDGLDVIQISIKQAIEHMAVPDPEVQEFRDAVAYQMIGLIRSLCDESMRRILDDDQDYPPEPTTYSDDRSIHNYGTGTVEFGPDPYFPDGDLE